MSSEFAISIDDVRRAAERLNGVAVKTPLLEFEALNARVGRRVLVKFEGAQHKGAFKFRGAYNRISAIPQAQRPAGVVAWSSGNHAQGVAAAARRLAAPAVIVMPSDAPEIKKRNTAAEGAEIVLYERNGDEPRERIAARLIEQRGATPVPPYDDPFVIAGQGTVGLEIAEQAEARGARVGAALVCCGGGGLVAGVATALKHHDSEIAVFAVEPQDFDDTARSLASGRRESIAPGVRSICDAILTPSPGELTFPINKALLSGALSVSDDEVRAAMRFAFERMKLVVEPGGAVALAAALSGKAPPAPDVLAVVISGANVDPQFYAEVLRGA